MKLKLKENRIFWRENIKTLTYFTQNYNGRHCVTLRNLYTTSSLSILLHGVISLPGATSCDKVKHQEYMIAKLERTLRIVKQGPKQNRRRMDSLAPDPTQRYCSANVTKWFWIKEAILRDMIGKINNNKDRGQSIERTAKLRWHNSVNIFSSV